MRKYAILFVAAFALSLGSAALGSAEDSFLGINYTASVPLGNTSDWTSKMSWRGVGIDYRRFKERDISFGFYAGWNVFNEKSYETAKRPSVPGHITGNMNRYINAFPLMLTAHKYFGNPGRQDVRGYAGLGAGAISQERRIEVGLFADEKNRWHIGLAPEVGLIKPVSWDTSVYGALKWNYGFKSSDVAVSYISFNIGLATF